MIFLFIPDTSQDKYKISVDSTSKYQTY